jgi:hypothetical protein
VARSSAISPPRSAREEEEMEDRSSQRTRALITHIAPRGITANEIGRGRISMLVRSTRAPMRNLIHWSEM